MSEISIYIVEMDIESWNDFTRDRIYDGSVFYIHDDERISMEKRVV